MLNETISDDFEPVQPGNVQESNGEESPNLVTFEENGEMIEMEINASEEGFESELGTETEMESDSDTDNEVEVGEIIDDLQNDDEEANAENGSNKPSKSKKGQNRHRQSVEDRLEKMSDTLLTMQDLIVKNRLLQNNSQQAGSSKTSKADKGNVNLNSSDSDMTVYRKVLLKDSSNENNNEDEDPEITFKVDQEKINNRDSTSSEERIDTSDELMEVGMDIEFNERFIADCAREAKRRQTNRNPEMDDNLRRAEEKWSEDVICEAEAGKAKMFKTPGRSY